MQFEAVACRLFLHYSYTLAQKASNYGIFCFYNTFKLDGDVSKGSIHVIVENENKETILDLTPEIKTGMLTVDEKCRYFLIL